VELVLKDVTYVHSPSTPFERKVKMSGKLTVESGKLVLLTGKNGSGKTTILQIAAVLLKPLSGEISIDGEDPWRDPWKFRRMIGFSFQFPENQFFEMRVFDEVVFAPKNFGLDDLEERYEKAMGIAGLDPKVYRDRLPFALSGGEKRKVAIASIISHDPEILILDEPLVGLDLPSRLEILDFLKSWKEMGKSALVATHRVEDFEKIADGIFDLDQNS